MTRFLAVLVCSLFCITTSGCASTATQIASGVASAGGSFLVNHTQGVTVSYNPGTGEVGANLIFKNGRWVQQGALGPVPARAVGEICEDAPVRALPRGCVEETRAVEARGCVEPTRSVLRTATALDLRSITEGGGLRAIHGPLLSSRSISRAVAAEARAVRKEEEETYRALKEIHDAEDHRLKLIIRATNPSVWGQFNRFVRGTPCISPLTQQTAPVAPNQYFDPAPAQLPDPANNPTQPPPVATGADGGFSIPPAAQKAIGTLEARVTALESNCKGLDAKVDKVIALLEKRLP